MENVLTGASTVSVLLKVRTRAHWRRELVTVRKKEYEEMTARRNPHSLQRKM